jgi:hypothetical protein
MKNPAHQINKAFFTCIIAFLLVISTITVVCASVINAIQTQKDSGRTIYAVYEQNWETVYDAAKFVLRHSENKDIGMKYPQSFVDFAVEDKAIYSTRNSKAGYGVFFEPLGEYRTKVDCAATGIQKDEIVLVLFFEELSYLLDHGQQAYCQYTLKLEEKRQKENMAANLR